MRMSLTQADLELLAKRLKAHPHSGPDVDIDEVIRRLLDDHYALRDTEAETYIGAIRTIAARLPEPSTVAMP